MTNSCSEIVTVLRLLSVVVVVEVLWWMMLELIEEPRKIEVVLIEVMVIMIEMVIEEDY